ncbi:MAG: dGTP triphosphohydrolase [Oscillospiraceae bacterium]
MPQMTWDRLLSTKRSREIVTFRAADVRTEFAKDYHRILSSPSFRRLQDKTQVFPLDRGDFVRTRLTHSLEVSSFAGSIGDTAFLKLMETRPEITSQIRQSCLEILRCAGLVHDIGNPPFGHFGEDTIRQWFGENLSGLKLRGRPVSELLTDQMKGDFLHFEGNAQALRVLSKLHVLIDIGNGMNLTYALLNTIIKYPVSSLDINKKSGNIKDKKMGFYSAEQPLFEDITRSTGAAGCRYPLTFLLESADDIAYKTADIEDAAIKKLISYNELLSEISSEKYLDRCKTEQEHAALTDAANNLRHCLESAQNRGLPSAEKKAIQRWTVNLQSTLIYAASDAFVDNYDQIMNGEFKRELLAASTARVLADALSDIAYRYAFRSSGILKTELSAHAMMNTLLDSIVGTALRFGTEQQRITDGNLMALLPEEYLMVCQKSCEGREDGEQAYYRLLFATDCVCSMTDGYARELFRTISGIEA